MRTNIRVLAHVALVATLACPAFAAAPTSDATGKVEDAQGNPLVGAVVTFVNMADEKAIYEAKTDKKGKYFVSGLFYVPPGNWKVAVQAEGYAPSKIRVESKTQAQIVAKFEENVRPGSTKVVLIRPFGEARIDFVMVPADQVPQAAENPGLAAAAPTDPLAKAAERISQGDFEGAVPFYKESVEKSPEDSDRRVEFAKILFKLERYPEAEAQALKAAELAPDKPGAHRLLASIYAANDEYDRASAAIQKERKISPNDTAVLALTAQLAEETGKTDEAIEADEAIVRINPDNVQAWVSLGDLYARKGQADKSEAAFRKVSELDPANAHQTFYNIGVVIMNKQPRPTTAETRKAIEAFRKAVEKKPDYGPAQKQLAFALLSVNEVTDARKAIERYLEIEPKDQEMRELINGLPKK